MHWVLKKLPKCRVIICYYFVTLLLSSCCLKKRFGSWHLKIYETINILVYSGTHKRQTLRKKKKPWPLLLLFFWVGMCCKKKVLAFITILYVWWRFLAFFIFFYFFYAAFFFPLSLSLVFYFTTVCRQTSASVLFTNLQTAAWVKVWRAKIRERKI